MTSVRFKKEQIMDNLDKTARDLVSYVLSAKREDLVGILEATKQQYQKTSSQFWPISLAQRLLHLYSRQRTPAIDEALEKVTGKDIDSYAFLEVFENFMKEGNCEPTSANTWLLLALIEKQAAYKSLDEDERLGKGDLSNNVFKMGVVKSLRDAFVTHAQNEVLVYKNLQKINSKVALPQPNKLSKSLIDLMDAQFANGATSPILNKPEPRPVAENNPVLNVKYASVISQLKGVYRAPKNGAYEAEARRLRDIDVSGNDVSESFASARASLSLFMRKGNASQAAPVANEQSFKNN